MLYLALVNECLQELSDRVKVVNDISNSTYQKKTGKKQKPKQCQELKIIG